ncbi:hypothetical protein [Rhodopirellula bahusiensis]|uniref:hypothetical protein n=1 Tax=Rhodopirellula bahusiensis TaxID=2014065 RepID=UPI0032671D19
MSSGSPIKPEGRSGLLRVAAMPPVRRRSYARRWAIVLLVGAGLSLLTWAVATDWFSTTGPFRFLYAVHDAVFLPLRGTVWTQIFPFAFLWAFPLFFFFLAVFLELLTKASLLRVAHRGSVRLALRSLVGRWFILTSDTFLRALGTRAEFSRNVVRSELVGLSEVYKWDAWENAIGFRTAVLHDTRRFSRLTSLEFKLSAGDASDVIAAVEFTKLAQLIDRQKMTMPEWLATELDTPLGGPDWEWKSALRDVLDPPELFDAVKLALTLTKDLDGDLQSPAALASRYFAVCSSALEHRVPDFRVALRTWDRSLKTSASIEKAERLFAVEFWSALADVATIDADDVTALEAIETELAQTDFVGNKSAFEGRSTP